MKIILHQPNGVSVTFTDCELLSTTTKDGPYLLSHHGSWLRFKGTNDLGRDVVIATSLPVEIYE